MNDPFDGDKPSNLACYVGNIDQVFREFLEKHNKTIIQLSGKCPDLNHPSNLSRTMTIKRLPLDN